jgi:hypothetical protein
MKHLILLFLGLSLVMPVMGQKNIDQIFRKYKNDEGVVNMNLTGEVLKMFAGSKDEIKSTVESVDVLIFKNNEDISAEDKSKIESVLNRDKFDLLVDVRDKGQNVKMFAVESGKYLNKIYANVNSAEMNAYFILSGNIIFEELAKMGMDFEKGDPLKVINKSRGKN